MTTAKKFDLLRVATANGIRAAANAKGTGQFSCQEIEYGTPEIAIASGRGKCRCCGQRIPKGISIVKFFFDFHGWWIDTVHLGGNVDLDAIKENAEMSVEMKGG